MKLVSLKINEKFRGLEKGFEIMFEDDEEQPGKNRFAPYCFVGRNGSGKSNVLEALASIFYHLECMYLNFKPIGFEKDDEEDIYDVDFGEEPQENLNDENYTEEDKRFDRIKCSPDAFELTYYISSKRFKEEILSSEEYNFEHPDNALIKITKNFNEAPQAEWLNIPEPRILTGPEIKNLLPEYLIGYSSGENEILSLPFFKMRLLHFDEFKDRLIRELDYARPEGRMVYLDKQYSQAVFLSNYLFKEKTPLDLILDTLEIESINEFRIVIKKDLTISNYPSFDAEENKPSDYKRFKLIQNLENKIQILKNCSTSNFTNPENGNLYLDYLVTPETEEAFKLLFGTAQELFQLFQILFTLNSYHLTAGIKKRVYRSNNLYINDDVIPVVYDDERIIRFKEFKIKKKNAEEQIFMKALSDGEHQFLHSIGVCILFKDKETLFLLDEPETHFNPDWRAKFISTLKKCLTGSDETNKVNGELLITSHSPFIVSDCKRENVFKFTKGKAENPQINTFGTSISILTEEIFDKGETISKLGEAEIQRIKSLPMETLEDIEKAKEESRSVGESVEKVLLFREIIIKEEKLKRDNDTKL
jgi:restriction system-associated AAA family ATPase